MAASLVLSARQPPLLSMKVIKTFSVRIYRSVQCTPAAAKMGPMQSFNEVTSFVFAVYDAYNLNSR